MGSSKKHKRDKDVVRRHKKRSRSRSKSRSRSASVERHDRKHYKKHHRERRHRRRSADKSREEYHSDSSDVIEVPVAPPAPVISSKRARSPSPIPEGGVGDCLSIVETNKLRAKLGLKPLEVESGPVAKEKSSGEEKKGEESEYKTHKDDLGEFVHKPATNFAATKQAEKIREKIKERREKRQLEGSLLKVKSLAASDDEDDLVSWVDKTREKERLRKEAEKRAKWLEEMEKQIDEESHDDRETHQPSYGSRDLRGLRVEHDSSDFGEGKTVILTLKDQEVLNEDGDTLINVNLMDTERYRKNVENKKQNPLNYGYDCYAEEMDEFGQPISRAILKKYDDEIEGGQKKSFMLGKDLQEEQEHKRKLLEIRCKLNNKRLETLNEQLIKPATDYYTEAEMAKFKKPKKKVKKSKRTLKADDLLPLPGDEAGNSRDMGRRHGRTSSIMDIDDIPEEKVKIEPEDDDLEKMLSKARRLKQKESLISKPIDTSQLKREVKNEVASDEEVDSLDLQSNQITLNATAEFCRTLGDIPTYGMAGNREGNTNDLIDFEHEMDVDEKDEEPEDVRGTWNSVNANELELEENSQQGVDDMGDVAILGEEPDVSAGVAGALRLAVSKGYLERDDSNRPSNTRMAHLQAKNYSIEDKTYTEDDKFGRRDRYHCGPSSDFKEKDGFKPNVKLEYIDDGGRVLNAKEAFRYLSHKFHGKGPGKNKIEKRLKKSEQEGLMMKMSSTDTPLGTLNMLQAKQKETNSPYIVLSGTKQNLAGSNIVKHKSK